MLTLDTTAARTEAAEPEWAQVAADLIHARQTVLPKRLLAPGPRADQLQTLLGAAAAAPDHGQLLPWRFVTVPRTERGSLAEVFAQALRERDATATPEQLDQAREKALRQRFGLHAGEHALCFMSVGTVAARRPARTRPTVADYCSTLGPAPAKTD
jgi:hypothetical protein